MGSAAAVSCQGTNHHAVSYFQTLDLPPFPDLLNQLQSLVSIEQYHQICLNSIPGKEDNHQFGSGSLFYDWDKSTKEIDENGNKKLVVPQREIPLDEFDFTETCTIFRGTFFEDILSLLKERFIVGRTRIIKMSPKKCMSWHKDSGPRIHYPIKTQIGCLMVIEDEVKHLEQDTWYLTDTTKYHTALNASKEDRLHIVACVKNNT